jgi:hypothetical protein
MFASLFVSPQPSSRIWPARAVLQCVALGSMALAEAMAAPSCKPALAFRQVSFSPINHETMRRRWTATLSVDGSRCATATGRFEILFVLWSETAQDDEFIQAFDWARGVTVAVDVAAHEAIGGYALQDVAPCPCREQPE